MRIAIVTNGYPPANASMSYVHARAKAYNEAGQQVRVFTRLRRGTPSRYSHEGVVVHKLGANQTVQEVKAFGPDVIAVHSPHRWSIQVASRLPYPKVSWIHGHEALPLSNYYSSPNPLGRLLFWLYDLQKFWRLKLFLKQCAAVVFVSLWIKGEAEKHIGYGHPVARVIPNPVDTDRFRPQKDCLSQGDAPRGVAIRNLTSSKYGLDIAIRAFSNLSETSLTIIGSGPLGNAYRHLIAALEANVTIVSQRFDHNEMPGVINRYDYFVAPSRLEAQGVAMCEAMACGLPVVAARVGGIPEFVADGEDGYLVEPENPEALRAAVLRLVGNRTQFQGFSRRAREHVVATCGGDAVAQRELEILADASECKPS